MFCIPSFDEMTDLTPYFNHVIPGYAGIQTVSHSASQVEELCETGSASHMSSKWLYNKRAREAVLRLCLLAPRDRN